MTAKEFIIWFRGFVKAANGYNVTPKQWEDISTHLENVELEEPIKATRYLLDNNSSWSITNTKESESNITHGRDKDSITYTIK